MRDPSALQFYEQAVQVALDSLRQEPEKVRQCVTNFTAKLLCNELVALVPISYRAFRAGLHFCSTDHERIRPGPPWMRWSTTVD